MNFIATFGGMLDGPQGIIILLIILLLFGAKKIPELAKGLGQAIKEFNKAKDNITDEINKAGEPTAADQTGKTPGENQALADSAKAAGATPTPANKPPIV